MTDRHAEASTEIREAAARMQQIEEVGCLDGIHDFAPVESDSVPGMTVKRGACRGCGRWPYEAAVVLDD